MLVLGPELLLAVVPRKRAAKLAAIFFDRNVIMWNTIYVCCVFVCVRFFPSLILSASLWHGTASHFVCECACVCVCLLFWAQCCTRGLIFRWRVTVITNNGRVAPSCAVLYLVWGVRD
jgi:hypothetical protein